MQHVWYKRQFTAEAHRCTRADDVYLRCMKVWNQVGIVGAGTMGSGIAQIAAQAGCQVVLVDASEDALARSENNLNKVFSRLVEKGRLTEVESDQIKGRIHRTTSIDALATAELVIEAIVEDLGVKTELFQRLEHIVDKTKSSGRPSFGNRSKIRDKLTSSVGSTKVYATPSRSALPVRPMRCT